MGKGVAETRSEEPLKSFFLFLASLWLRLCLWHKEGAVAEAHDDDDDDDDDMVLWPLWLLLRHVV